MKRIVVTIALAAVLAFSGSASAMNDNGQADNGEVIVPTTPVGPNGGVLVPAPAVDETGQPANGQTPPTTTAVQHNTKGAHHARPTNTRRALPRN